LVQSLTANGRFDQSILKVTWTLYLEDISQEVTDLGGGMIGAVLFASLRFLLAETGTLIAVFFLVIIGLMLMFGFSYIDLLRGIRRFYLNMVARLKAKAHSIKELISLAEESEQNDSAPLFGKKKKRKGTGPYEDHKDSVFPDVPDIEQDPVIKDFTDVAYDHKFESQPNVKENEQTTIPASSSLTPKVEMDPPLEGHSKPDTASQVIAYPEEGDGAEYKLPPFSLLRGQSKHEQAGIQDIRANARKLERTLESFGVNAKVTQVHRGPAVTRYEVQPAVGVKVSRVVNLSDDIALALAAKGIRMEAPIPGKSAIGIEVPNKDVAMVTLREVLESPAFRSSPSKLSIALGRDISGEPIVAQLNKMPHLLVAGATGSGKSVCINSIITSILYKAKPHEVKMMMVDPKMVELNVYNGIPHLLAPVVTDPKKAAVALKKVVSEMEHRYELFAQSGTRDIERYNELIRRENQVNNDRKPLLPYIVVIIDELADLMMVAPGDVEDAICRLAQMARAAGIHLIIATQRPSVDVITGVIKANIPSRIAFGVSSQADSRTILDMGGAEKLLGRGDMLFLPVGANKPLRVQGAFISDEEVQQVVTYCVNQQQVRYHEVMIPDHSEDNDRESVDDELYEQAVNLVIQQGSASVSMLQRRFRIGYTRAARLIDAMEANGIVGPYEGSKPRDVLVSKEKSHIS
jgi:S-DNA-T family DNA segregation ATPase FtsK/SpoIIIE